MQADMEIQSAAKLPTRHRRWLGGTGARSALNSLLDCSSASWPAVNSLGLVFMRQFGHPKGGGRSSLSDKARPKASLPENPNSEGRNPKEARNPRADSRKVSVCSGGWRGCAA